MRSQSQRIRHGLALCLIGVGAAVVAPTFSSRGVAKADATPDCATLGQHVIYISGSSAIGPVISHLAYALAKAGDPLTVVADNVGSTAPGSCVGVNTALTTNLSGTSEYWPNDPNYDPDSNSVNTVGGIQTTLTGTCNLPTTQRADIAASDVYPTSCPQITSAKLAGFNDFDPGFLQAMEFVIGANDTQSPPAISQEAAYLTFGFGADSTTEWSDPNKIFVRDQNSGTMQMISAAIGVPANKVVMTSVAANTSDMAMKLSGAGVGAIGIMAATDAEATKYGGQVKPLAFQATGQTCAYWPNSGPAAHDKARVRDGHYAIWGRFHILTAVDGQGNPINPDVARFINILTGKEQVPGVDVPGLLIANNTILKCAMQVTRDAEMGPMSSFVPDKSCGCYFDTVTGGGGGCVACQTDADCTTARPKCNHWGANNNGYCEVQ